MIWLIKRETDELFQSVWFLTFKQVIDENLHYKTLLKMVAEGKIDAEEKGLYHAYLIFI